MAFAITQGCVDIKDKACLESCPVECIYEGNRMTYIQPAECIDCGACEPLCPQEAIYYVPDLPADLVPYAQINAEFFTDIGSPGGSTKVDLTGRDHQAVATLPVGE